jgi:transposase
MDEQVSTAGGRRAAKARLVAGMVRGLPWREAAEAAGLPTGRTTAYRLRRDARLRGDAALDEGRHGHASKLREPVRRWLEAYCRGAPSASGSMAQAALRDRFGLDVSVRHINRVRATLGVSRISPQAGAGGAGGDRTSLAPPTSQPAWRDGAGGLLLLAAVHETGLLPALDTAVPRADGPVAPSHATGTRALLLTLLFLNAVGLRRTWDLRGYAGDGLALLTGRGRAYGYRHAEHVLSDLARAGAADPLADALVGWTTTLWRPGHAREDGQPAIFYVDGHRKPVYSDRLISRGLVARRGAVLGCRALTLLHDADGHPLLATTDRGDTHLTAGAPVLLGSE